jgi:VWFA-related protein
MKLRKLLLPILLLTTLHGAFGQKLHQVVVRRIALENYPALRMFVSVTDFSGQSLTGLTAQQFALEEDGQAVKADSVASASELNLPVSCVLAVDVSGSMAKEKRIEAARSVATDFVRKFGGNDRIALITFGTQVSLVQDFSNDKGALEKAIGAFSPEQTGYTHLYDALHQAQKLLLSQPTERKVIVVLTDGKDEGSFLKEDDIIGESQKSNIPVYAMGFGVQADIPERVLGRIATLTSGSYEYAMTSQQLSGIFARLSDDLRNEYVLQYETVLPADGLVHDVTLSVAAESDTVRTERRVETPVRAGFWTTRRIILGAVVGALVVVLAGLVIWRRKRAGAAEGGHYTGPGISEGVPEQKVVTRDRLRESTSEESTAAIEEDHTRVIGSALRLKAWFVIRQGPSRGEEILIDNIPAVIGRGAKADVRLKDATVSAQHAKLFMENDTVYLQDLASTNGTFVNEKKIVKSGLKDNDRVRFGEVETVFKCVRLTDT